MAEVTNIPAEMRVVTPEKPLDDFSDVSCLPARRGHPYIYIKKVMAHIYKTFPDFDLTVTVSDFYSLINSCHAIRRKYADELDAYKNGKEIHLDPTELAKDILMLYHDRELCLLYYLNGLVVDVPSNLVERPEVLLLGVKYLLECPIESFDRDALFPSIQMALEPIVWHYLYGHVDEEIKKAIPKVNFRKHGIPNLGISDITVYLHRVKILQGFEEWSQIFKLYEHLGYTVKSLVGK